MGGHLRAREALAYHVCPGRHQSRRGSGGIVSGTISHRLRSRRCSIYANRPHRAWRNRHTQFLHPSSGTPSVGTPSVGNPSVGNPSVGNSSVGNSSVGNSSVGSPSAGNPSGANSSVGTTSGGTPYARTRTARGVGTLGSTAYLSPP